MGDISYEVSPLYFLEKPLSLLVKPFSKAFVYVLERYPSRIEISVIDYSEVTEKRLRPPVVHLIRSPERSLFVI